MVKNISKYIVNVVQFGFGPRVVFEDIFATLLSLGAIHIIRDTQGGRGRDSVTK